MLCCGFNLLTLADCASAAPHHLMRPGGRASSAIRASFVPFYVLFFSFVFFPVHSVQLLQTVS